MAKLIDGKGIAAEVRADIKARAAEFAKETVAYVAEHAF